MTAASAPAEATAVGVGAVRVACSAAAAESPLLRDRSIAAPQPSLCAGQMLDGHELSGPGRSAASLHSEMASHVE